MTTPTQPAANRHYLTVWRWHFYAGLFTAPFLMLLATTGLAMLLFANITGREGERMRVTPQAVVQPLSAQAEAARQAIRYRIGGAIHRPAPSRYGCCVPRE